LQCDGDLARLVIAPGKANNLLRSLKAVNMTQPAEDIYTSGTTWDERTKSMFGCLRATRSTLLEEFMSAHEPPANSHPLLNHANIYHCLVRSCSNMFELVRGFFR
jgi:hypothetical protein